MPPAFPLARRVSASGSVRFWCLVAAAVALVFAALLAAVHLWWNDVEARDFVYGMDRAMRVLAVVGCFTTGVVLAARASKMGANSRMGESGGTLWTVIVLVAAVGLGLVSAIGSHEGFVDALRHRVDADGPGMVESVERSLVLARTMLVVNAAVLAVVLMAVVRIVAHRRDGAARRWTQDRERMRREQAERRDQPGNDTDS